MVTTTHQQKGIFTFQRSSPSVYLKAKFSKSLDLKAFWILFVLLFAFAGRTFSQTATTTVFTDNFNRGSAVTPINAGGTPVMTYTTTTKSDVTVTAGATSRALLTSGTDYALQVLPGNLGTTSVSYRTYVSGAVNNFSSPFSAVLSSNPGDVTWAMHMRTNRGSFPLSGLGSGNYGGGTVLAATSSVLDTLGDGYAVIFDKQITATGVTVIGNTSITLSSPSAAAIGVIAGMTVTGSGIPAGSTVSSVSGNQIVISAAPTSASSSRSLTFAWTNSGSTTSGSTTVTLTTAANSSIYVGQQITGTNIPTNATITAISADRLTLTISAAATATGSGITMTLGSGTSIKLIKYTGGLTKGTRTPMLVPTTDFFIDGNKNYWAAVKVVYTPSTNTWQLMLRLDAQGSSGTTGSTSPNTDFSSGFTSVGTIVDNSYTGSTMTAFGFLWNHSFGATYDQNAMSFDNFSVSVASTNPTLTNPSVSDITSTSALLGATVAAGSPAAITSRGTLYKTTSGVTYADNLLAEGGTTTGAFTHTRSGFTPETQYFYKGFATNIASNSTYAGLSSESSFRTLSSPPSAQATSLSGSGVSNAQIDLSWSGATFPSSGATSKQYLLLMAAAPNTPVFTGANGAAPTVDANTTIVSASIASAATTYSVIGLAQSTAYNFVLIPYTYDGTNSSTYNYLTASAPTVSASTTAGAAPSLSAPTATSITNTSAVLGATIDNDGGSSLTSRGTVYSTVSPATISNNLLAEGGTSVTAFSHIRSGLSPETKYFFKGYAVNSAATGLTSESSFFTLSNPPTSAVSSLVATPASGEQVNLSWSSASFPSTGATVKGYVIIRSLYPSVPSLSNSNGQVAAAGSGTTIVSASVAGASTSSSVEGLTGSTSYNFAVVPFTWDGVNAATYNYYTTSVPTANTTTLSSTPADQPTGLSITSITCNGMTVNWNAASSNPTGYIVLQSAGATAPNTNPTNGTVYSVNNSIGNATVVYVGNGSSVVLTSLADNTNYNYKVYSFNGTGSNISYLTTSPLSGASSTSLVAAPVANAASSIYSNEFTANWSAVAPCANGYALDVATTSSFTANGTIVAEGFENSLSLFTQSGVLTGAFRSGNTSATADRPISSPYAAEGTYGFSENSNGTASSVVITSNNINTSAYTNPEMSFKLAAFAVGSTTGGQDAGDSVTVSVSPDGGTTWYQTLKVNGSTTGNSVWTYNESGVASTPYDGNNTPVLFSATSVNGVTDGTGYSNVKITGLPVTNNLKISISMKSSAGNEYWVIDDFKVTGSAGSFAILPAYNGLPVSGTSQLVTGLSAGTPYYYRVRAVGNNGNSINSNTITVNTLSAVAPVVASQNVSNITSTSATLGATVSSIGSTAALTARGTVYKTSAGVTITDNASVEGGTTATSFTQNRTGLDPQTQYFYAGYASNASASALSEESNFYTLSSPVSAQASSFAATAISGAQIDLSWSAATFPETGATVKGYIILRALYPAVPALTSVNGQAPSVTSASTIVNANVSNAATTFAVTSLSGLTRYNFVIVPFTWDGVNAATYNYLTSNAPSADATTLTPLADLPGDQPTQLTFSSITCNGMTLNWSAASSNPSGYLVLSTNGSIAPNTDPSSTVTYSVGQSIGNATVAFVGSGTSANISSLSDNSNYNFKIYSYNGSGSLINYLTIDPLTGSNSTVTVSTPAAVEETNVTTTSFTANWNSTGCASNYLLDVSAVDSFSRTANVAQWSLFRGLNSDTLNSNSLNQTRQISVAPASTISYLTGFSGSSSDTAIGTTGWNSVGKAWVVEINTTGYSNLSVSSAQKSSASGPRDFRLEYKIGAGGTYSPVTNGTLAVNSVDYSTGTLTDLPLPSDCNNQSSVFLRWVTTGVVNRGDGAATGVSSGGTNRIDNILIKGATSNYLTGYEGITVNGTSATITGLTPNTYYYYRVRAVAPNSTSGYSNLITAQTNADQAVADFRTKASGSFDNLSIWEYASGAGYATATILPTSTNNITISVNDSVALTSSVSVDTLKTFTVNGKLVPGLNDISGLGSFALSSGATIYIADTAGLNGTVSTRVKTYSTSGNYTFNGTQPQSTGGLPSTSTANVIIDNAAGVTLDGSKVINTPGTLLVKGILNFGTATVPYNITGTGSFTAKTGSTLVITTSAGINPAGVNSGSMRLTGTRVFENNVNYNFSKDDLSANQLKSQLGSSFGSEITSINNLIINNARGVSDTVTNAPSITINGQLIFTSGHFYKKSNKVILAEGASVSRTLTSGWVIGSLQKNIATGSSTTTYEVGTDSLNYTPITVSFNNVSNAGSLAASPVVSAHPNIIGSSISSTKRLNFYASLSSSDIAFDNYSASINFAADNILSGADYNNFIAAKYDGSSWTAATIVSRTATNVQLSGLSSLGDIQIGESCNTSSIETITACDSYTWHGTTFTTSNNTATWIGTNADGCDSLVTLNLTIVTSTSSTEVISACDSYAWTLTGDTYTASGVYPYVVGCYTQYLNLTITPSTVDTSIVSSCDSYTWSVNGQVYTTSGTYSQASGCQTNVLILTITPSTSHTTQAFACDTYTWSVSGLTYTTSGTYTFVTGCHTEILVLNITSSVYDTTRASACNSYTWSVNGQTYTTSGTYSIVGECYTSVLVLTINTPSSSTQTVTACNSYLWNGVTYTTSGVKTFNTTNAAGCDSIATLDLTINNCNTTLNVKVFLEGAYRGAGTMAATLYDLTLSTDATATDSIEVNLWSASSLGNATPNYSVKVLLHTDGTATAIFPGATLGNAYYVAIKHRNSIETWSANLVTIDAVTNYDFTTGLNKAYSDGATPSMKSLGGGVFGFYGGDVNLDGTVDGSDMNDVDNNTALGAFGYDSSDVNGDGATDGLDMNVVDNNTQIGLFYARPY